MSNKNVRFEPFCWLPAASLPGKLRRYIDPDRPLLGDDQFHPSACFSVIYLLWSFFWLLAFALLFVTMSTVLAKELLAWSSNAPSPYPHLPLVLTLGLQAISIFGGYRSWIGVAKRRELRRAWKEGRFREGLFVLDDGLLLHQTGQVYHLPKKSIVGFTEVSRGRHERPDFQVLYNSREKARARKSLHHLDLATSNLDLERQLWAWLEDRGR